MARFLSGLFILCLFCMFVTIESKNGCGPNEKKAPCGRYCEPTCVSPDQSLCKFIYRVCKTDCRCKEGFFRAQGSDRCVTMGDCYRKPYSVI